MCDGREFVPKLAESGIVMKKKLICGMAAAAAIYCAPAHAQATLDDFGKFYRDAPSGYVSVGAVIMQRSRPNGGATVAANPDTTTAFQTAKDFDFNRGTGVDATVGVRFWRTEAIEARLLSFAMDASSNFVTPGGFIGAGFTGPGGTVFASQYETKMQSWEVNWRHQLLDQLNVLAGVRSISVRDALTYTLNTTVAGSQYNYNNRLLGVQIGADWAILPLTSPFQINVFGKIGRYSLRTDGGIDEFQGINPIGSFQDREKDHVYAGEAGVSVGYRLSNNVLIRAGYQALWLNNLGLASNNASASLTNPSLLRTNVYRGDLLLQGVNFGMTISY